MYVIVYYEDNDDECVLPLGHARIDPFVHLAIKRHFDERQSKRAKKYVLVDEMEVSEGCAGIFNVYDENQDVVEFYIVYEVHLDPSEVDRC